MPNNNDVPHCEIMTKSCSPSPPTTIIGPELVQIFGTSVTQTVDSLAIALLCSTEQISIPDITRDFAVTSIDGCLAIEIYTTDLYYFEYAITTNSGGSPFGGLVNRVGGPPLENSISLPEDFIEPNILRKRFSFGLTAGEVLQLYIFNPNLQTIDYTVTSSFLSITNINI
ncbi:MAG: hypothetical protein Harvfovirus26_12 [Harvfovirus sp.]|uniref:Uncharacterized protein n=1 Tax=Harvfovirus sp. TaxID=2487768 RepID=A0A3G5A499_9VIRU|nr:MAG: hypothetical protein Harvfovirus26_12 [Harvfovirus sp.]